MIELGEISYNESGGVFCEKYPALLYGTMRYNFEYNNDNYVIEVFYNTQAECLFYSVYNESGDVVQSQYMLKENTDLITDIRFLDKKIVLKNNKLYMLDLNEGV